MGAVLVKKRPSVPRGAVLVKKRPGVVILAALVRNVSLFWPAEAPPEGFWAFLKWTDFMPTAMTVFRAW